MPFQLSPAFFPPRIAFSFLPRRHKEKHTERLCVCVSSNYMSREISQFRLIIKICEIKCCFCNAYRDEALVSRINLLVFFNYYGIIHLLGVK